MTHLPNIFKEFSQESVEVKRVIMYPLLVHALKNVTQLKWSKAPLTVKEARIC